MYLLAGLFFAEGSQLQKNVNNIIFGENYRYERQRTQEACVSLQYMKVQYIVDVYSTATAIVPNLGKAILHYT